MSDLDERGNQEEAGSVMTGRSSMENGELSSFNEKVVIIACLVGIVVIVSVIAYLYFRRPNTMSARDEFEEDDVELEQRVLEIREK